MMLRLTTQPASYRLAALSYEDAGVVIESNRAPILPLVLVLCSHDDCVPYIASADLVRR